MQEKIIEELRQELKEQIKENQELEKKIDGLVTVIDLAKEYINHAQNYGTLAQVMPHLKPYVNGNDLLEILERVNEE